jgi:Ca2+-binding RTX toxin-like protein
MFLAVSTGDVLAGAVDWTATAGEMRGSGMGEVIHGTDGQDHIYGERGGDRIFGGEGADELYGGPGQDLVFGGSGDDFIEAKDGLRDLVNCGAGYDVVSVDDEDVISGGCEVVYRS